MDYLHLDVYKARVGVLNVQREYGGLGDPFCGSQLRKEDNLCTMGILEYEDQSRQMVRNKGQ